MRLVAIPLSAWLAAFSSAAEDQPQLKPPVVPESCGPIIGSAPGGTVKNVELPRLVSSAPPGYPKAAREARIEGKVLLNVLVCRDGTVGAVQVLRAPSPDLATAASEAVRGWLYRPAKKDGEPGAAYMTVAVDFTLKTEDP